MKPYEEVCRHVEDAALLIDMAASEKDPGQSEDALKEADRTLTLAHEGFRDLELDSLLNGKLDRNNAFLTLHAGAGGTESCDWTDMLFRMYIRYCEKKGFGLEVIEYQAGEEAVIGFILRQNEIIESLLRRVKELEDRLNKDSHNSSKPPSSDGSASGDAPPAASVFPCSHGPHAWHANCT